MILRRRAAVSPRPANLGDLAVLHSHSGFVFAGSHPLRAACCLACSQPIGGERATVIGVAALAGCACSCGSIASDTYLMHSRCVPAAAGQLTSIISRGLNCAADHQGR